MNRRYSELFHNLQNIRLQKKLTQAELAAEIGYELSSSISHVEAARKNISGQALIDWLYALDIDLLLLTRAVKNEQLDLALLNKAITKNVNVNQILEEVLEQIE